MKARTRINTPAPPRGKDPKLERLAREVEKFNPDFVKTLRDKGILGPAGKGKD